MIIISIVSVLLVFLLKSVIEMIPLAALVGVLFFYMTKILIFDSILKIL